MGTTWILCANSSRARIFEVDPHGPHGIEEPREIADYANPAGRQHERDQRSDAAGRFYGKGERNEGHAAAKEEGFGEHETERFVEHLRAELDRARNEHRFGQLWIAAAPAFLGLVRRNFAKELRSLVEVELDRDLTTEQPREVFARLLDARAAHRAKDARAGA
jgi:protein required for attachment to host cells